MAYRTVNERFWRDPKVLRLSSKDKLLFIYLITSADAHYSGVYYCPLQMIQLETGLNEKDVSKGVDTLSEGYMIEYDKGSNEVFVINMAKFQVVSKQQIQGVVNHFKETVQSQTLKASFIQKYDTLSIPYTIPCQIPIDTTETETERETETETEIKPKSKKEKSPTKLSFGIEKKVKLSQDEYNRLSSDFGKAVVDKKILDLENYLNKGNKYESHNLALRTFFRRDNVEPVKDRKKKTYTTPEGEEIQI